VGKRSHYSWVRVARGYRKETQDQSQLATDWGWQQNQKITLFRSTGTVISMFAFLFFSALIAGYFYCGLRLVLKMVQGGDR
tara:strand:- start:531 stop:773 length:243 start_codon:yes stop_codon:yes gene_type:complete